MRLSAAILAGAKLRPQAFGDFFLDGGSCAFGAAVEALTGLTDSAEAQQGGALNAVLAASGSVGCPKCEAPMSLWAMVPHLNDVHRASREWIAMWLEESGHDVELVP